MSSSRLPALALVAGVLAMLVLLAGSLSNLQLQPGAPFPGAMDSARTLQPSASLPTSEILSVPVLQGLLAVVSVVVAALVVARLVTLANWKVVLGLVFVLLSLLTLGSLLPRLSENAAAVGFPDQTTLRTLPTFSYRVTPLGKPPDFLLPLVAVALGLGFILLALNHSGVLAGQIRNQVSLRQEAERAVADLRKGRTVGGVVIRCYQNMCRTLQEARGIDRDQALTVEEFAATLLARGFPKEPVHQLTQLFEKARYGSERMSDKDEMLAMESLSEIVRFCGDASGGQ